MYSDSIKGGFVRSKASVDGVEQGNLVISPKGNEFKEGVEVARAISPQQLIPLWSQVGFGKCGDDPNVPASLDSCDYKEGQWELLPSNPYQYNLEHCWADSWILQCSPLRMAKKQSSVLPTQTP